jgi:hypothetical protein
MAGIRPASIPDESERTQISGWHISHWNWQCCFKALYLTAKSCFAAQAMKLWSEIKHPMISSWNQLIPWINQTTLLHAYFMENAMNSYKKAWMSTYQEPGQYKYIYEFMIWIHAFCMNSNTRLLNSYLPRTGGLSIIIYDIISPNHDFKSWVGIWNHGLWVQFQPTTWKWIFHGMIQHRDSAKFFLYYLFRDWMNLCNDLNAWNSYVHSTYDVYIRINILYSYGWWTPTEKDTEFFTKSKRLLQEFCSGKDCFSANDLRSWLVHEIMVCDKLWVQFNLPLENAFSMVLINTLRRQWNFELFHGMMA